MICNMSVDGVVYQLPDDIHQPDSLVISCPFGIRTITTQVYATSRQPVWLVIWVISIDWIQCFLSILYSCPTLSNHSYKCYSIIPESPPILPFCKLHTFSAISTSSGRLNGATTWHTLIEIVSC